MSLALVSLYDKVQISRLNANDHHILITNENKGFLLALVVSVFVIRAIVMLA